MLKIISGIVLFIFSVCWGWCLGRQYYYHWYISELKLENKKHEEQIKNLKEGFKAELADMTKAKDIERQDLNNKYIRILDEVSKVLGIDKIELPSFGTVYLNYTEKLREAMRALNEEG